MAPKDNSRLVYSTGSDGRCPTCGWPQKNCQCSSQRSAGGSAPVPDRIVARLRLEKKGRGGKAMTVIYDLPDNATFLEETARKLKRSCATGGAVSGNTIELQGDIRERVRALLGGYGWTVKG
ncbi:MAG: stress response translation initiation inhibitor YciH [Vicinamibacterales bacterium]